VKVIEEPQLAVKRKLPWILGVFLYPISASGGVHLGVFVILPLIFSFVVGKLGSFLAPILGYGTGYVMAFLTVPFYIVFYSYVVYYITDCVIDSSKGNFRAPDITVSDTVDAGDFVGKVFLLVGCAAICFWPAAVYYILREEKGWAFWLLLAGGVFFFPMALLRGSLFDSYDALNPISIIGSIASAFLAYCGLVLLFCLLSGFIGLVLPRLPVWGIVAVAVRFYLVFVLAHILGWFYWWHKDKLDWGL